MYKSGASYVSCYEVMQHYASNRPITSYGTSEAAKFLDWHFDKGMIHPSAILIYTDKNADQSLILFTTISCQLSAIQ